MRKVYLTVPFSQGNGIFDKKQEEQTAMQQTQKESDIEQFRLNATLYLETYTLDQLRAYGRNMGFRASTKLKKDKLITEIIAEHCKERPPDKKSRRGQPAKNNFFPLEIVEDINKLKIKYFNALDLSVSENCGENNVNAPSLLEDCSGKIEKEKIVPKPYYTITIRKSKGEDITSISTNLDFQIVLYKSTNNRRFKFRERR